MRIFIDGSSSRAKRGPNFIGWGVVAINVENHIELSGGLQGPTGLHEWVAAVHGIQLAMKHGVSPENLTLYSDSDWIGYANYHLHPQNYSPYSWVVRRDVIEVLELMGYPELEQDMLEYLQYSDTKWIKGHNFSIYQCRADYLAREAMRNQRDTKEAVLLPYDHWLSGGLTTYGKSGTTIWKAPFVA